MFLEEHTRLWFIFCVVMTSYRLQRLIFVCAQASSLWLMTRCARTNETCTAVSRDRIIIATDKTNKHVNAARIRPHRGCFPLDGHPPLPSRFFHQREGHSLRWERAILY